MLAVSFLRWAYKSVLNKCVDLLIKRVDLSVTMCIHCVDVLLCFVMFCYVLLCFVMFCYVLLCFVMFCYDVLVESLGNLYK